jgi:hypothetical protein
MLMGTLTDPDPDYKPQPHAPHLDVLFRKQAVGILGLPRQGVALGRDAAAWSSAPCKIARAVWPHGRMGRPLKDFQQQLTAGSAAGSCSGCAAGSAARVRVRISAGRGTAATAGRHASRAPAPRAGAAHAEERRPSIILGKWLPPSTMAQHLQHLPPHLPVQTGAPRGATGTAAGPTSPACPATASPWPAAPRPSSRRPRSRSAARPCASRGARCAPWMDTRRAPTWR